MIIISHDSRLLSRVCDDEERSEVWLVEDGKVWVHHYYILVHHTGLGQQPLHSQVEQYPGDFDDYKTELIKEITQELDDDEADIAAKNSAAVVRK